VAPEKQRARLAGAPGDANQIAGDVILLSATPHDGKAGELRKPH